MSRSTYFLGLLKHINNSRISKFALVDAESKISKTARVYFKTKIYKSKIGDYSYIAPNSTIVHTDIGKFCSIGSNCTIGLASHSIDLLSTSPIFTSKNNATGYSWVNIDSFGEYKEVLIGSDVWIGTRVIIMGGLKVGNGAVIGAGSIVTKDVPDYSIVAGVPAKFIRSRFSEQLVEKLLKRRWWDYQIDILKENIDLFSGKDNIFEDLDRFNLKI